MSDAFVNSSGGWAHQVITTTTGSTVQLSSTVAITIILGTLLLALTVNLPLSPIDGVKATFSIPAGVTLLSVTATAGQIVAFPSAAIVANGPAITYLYHSANTTWYRAN